MRTLVLFFALAAISSTFCQRVSGDLLIQMLQIGNDVVVKSEGTVDTDSLRFVQFSDTFGGSMQPVYSSSSPWAAVTTGVPWVIENPLVGIYTNANFAPVIGPSSFGLGTTFSIPDIGSGDVHGVIANPGPLSNLPAAITVPAGYVSGDTLSSEMTFANKSFVDLGVTEGTYNWSFEGNEVTLVIIVPVDLPPMLGDVNQDGEVTFADIPSFIEILIAGSFLDEADCNQDGEVTFADIPSFIEILTAG